MRTFLTADPHFDHKNIIEYCDRPFISVEHMNMTLIKNWNNTVTDDDEIYVVGDFAMSSDRERIKEIVSQLNGHKYLVMGNHDYLSVEDFLYAGFEKVYDQTIIIKEFIILSHAPIFITSNMPYYNIYGHVHHNPDYKDKTKNSWCVSVERTDYTPVELIMSDGTEEDLLMEANEELNFFHRMYSDLVISTEEAAALGHQFLTLEELFEMAPKIRIKLNKVYECDSTKKYVKVLQDQLNDAQFLEARIKKLKKRENK